MLEILFSDIEWNLLHESHWDELNVSYCFHGANQVSICEEDSEHRNTEVAAEHVHDIWFVVVGWRQSVVVGSTRHLNPLWNVPVNTRQWTLMDNIKCRHCITNISAQQMPANYCWRTFFLNNCGTLDIKFVRFVYFDNICLILIEWIKSNNEIILSYFEFWSL